MSVGADKAAEPRSAADDPTVAEMAKALRQHGRRVTPQRRATLRALLQRNAVGAHPTVDELHTAVRREYPAISAATVYNTVKTLRELGWIASVASLGSARYEARGHAPHGHLICEGCGQVTDVPSTAVEPANASAPALALDEIAADLAQRHGYVSVRPRLDFLGRCQRCAASGRPVADKEHETRE